MSVTAPSRRVAVVTGASAGIGAELARLIAADGLDLALTARDEARLRALAAEIAATGRPAPIVIPLDLAAPGAADQLADALAAAGAQVECLVNNAGFGLLGAAGDLDRTAQTGMIDLNVRALVDLTLRLLPQIVAARGRILNVASVAGFLPGPGMAVYYATKAFVVSFSDALAAEVRPSGVTVTCLCPGFTATEFQARAGIDAAITKGLPAMSARAVAQPGWEATRAGRRRIVTGGVNKLVVAALPFIPRSILLPIMNRLQRQRRHA